MIDQKCLTTLSVVASLVALAMAMDLSDVCSGEQNGNIVIQAEDTQLTSDWVFGTDVAGFTGRGYVSWLGPNQYQFEGRGILEYNICATGGVYKVNIWSMRLQKAGLRNDEGNDIWIKVGDDWVKLFTSFGSKNDFWKISSLFDKKNEKEEPLIRLREGCQVFEVAARSEVYSLDRFILVKAGSELDLNAGVSSCSKDAGGDGSGGGNNGGGDSGGSGGGSTGDNAPLPRCPILGVPRRPNRRTRVNVTFTNNRASPIRFYQRSQSGNLLYSENFIVNPGQKVRVNAFLYDMFVATDENGFCLQNQIIVGITGLRRRGGSQYSVVYSPRGFKFFG